MTKISNFSAVDINLKTGRGVGWAKKHNLVVKITIYGLERHFSFVSFSNFYPMIYIGQFKLCKAFDLTYKSKTKNTSF